MPNDCSSEKSEEIYRCPNLTVRAVALRSPRSNRPSRFTNSNLSHEGSHEINETPATLSREQLRQWHDNILSAMFKPSEKAPISTRGFSVFTSRTRPHEDYPLPLPDPDETATDMVYICQAPSVPGRFDVNRAKALNVPNGPIRRDLVNGQTIEFPDETAEGGRRTVTPEAVIGKASPGGVRSTISAYHVR